MFELLEQCLRCFTNLRGTYFFCHPQEVPNDEVVEGAESTIPSTMRTLSDPKGQPPLKPEGKKHFCFCVIVVLSVENQGYTSDLLT